MSIAGCANGGAQLRGEDPKTQLAKVIQLFKEIQSQTPESNPHLQFIRNEVLVDDETRKALLHTQYHPVEKNVNSLNIKW